VLKDEWLMQKYDFEYLGARWATKSDHQRKKSTKKAVQSSPPATRIQDWSLVLAGRPKEKKGKSDGQWATCQQTQL
jgi:hypothetical protein